MTLVWTAIILLAIFAVVNLVTGVVNDAVNFLSAAIGSRVTSRRVIQWVAATGIVIGVFLSAGLMEVARKGVIHPDHFFLTELLVVFLAVMITDIILIDCYNTLGLPTSTTVALMFELLGGAMAIVVLRQGDAAFVDSSNQLSLINTDRTLVILTGILISIFIALVAGIVAQFFARQIFTFHYENRFKFLQAFAGGVAITSISILLIKKALIGSPFIGADIQEALHVNLYGILILIMVCTTSLFLILGWALEMSIPGLVVIFGTFALGLAFAANDLVNYIGAPLTAIEAVKHYLVEPTVEPSLFPLDFLNDNLLRSDAFDRARWVHIFTISALIMVVTLFFSRRVRYVTDTEIRLCSQTPVNERFHASYLSRILARNFSHMHLSIVSLLPPRALHFVQSRYKQDKPLPKHEPSSQGYFDPLRASVNLVVSSILISTGTLMNFPLSTTFVVFMVAMGTSIADKAWVRETAVYRIAGMLTIIGSWLMTCVLAFVGSFVLTMVLSKGGIVAILIATVGTFVVLIANHFRFRRREREQEVKSRVHMTSDVIQPKSTNTDIAGEEIRKKMLEGSKIYLLSLEGLIQGRLSAIEEAQVKANGLKSNVEQTRKDLFVNFAKASDDLIDSSQYHVQAVDFLSDYSGSLVNLSTLILTHALNNHKGATQGQQNDINDLLEEVTTFLNLLNYIQKEKRFSHIPDLVKKQNILLSFIEELRVRELKRIKNGEGHTRMNILLMEILAETKNIMLLSVNILKSHRDIVTSLKQ